LCGFPNNAEGVVRAVVFRLAARLRVRCW
jgi:hypothetical protein